jgi:hypothetical protein
LIGQQNVKNMNQKANAVEEEPGPLLEENKEDIISKYKELGAKCDYVIEKIAKKRKKQETK